MIRLYINKYLFFFKFFSCLGYSQKTEQLLFEVGKPLRKQDWGERKKQYWKLSFRCVLCLNCLLALPVGDVKCIIRFVSLALRSAQNSDVTPDVISTKVTLKPVDMQGYIGGT